MMTIQDVLKRGNYTLIDVREPMELATDGKIEGAINIPLGQLPEKIGEIKEIEGAKIVFCRSGGRSSNAQQYLIQNDVAEVYNGGSFMMLHYMLLDSK